MSTVRIFGIGSPFGHDQLGWKAIDLLLVEEQIQFYLQQGLTIEKLDRPGIKLLSAMSGGQYIFLIDAVKSDAPFGTIHHLQDQQIEKISNFLSGHEIGLGETLHLGRSLQLLPAHIIFYGIEIDNIFPFQTFSNELLNNLNQLINRLLNELKYIPFL